MQAINKIKGYRNMLGLTQSDMAKELGISKQAMHLKEVGKIPFKDSEKRIVLNIFKQADQSLTIESLFF
ncbi:MULTISPECIES: helix-turn-helix transcriptional regulator [Aerococcus]|uniref:Transcriptional regulator n=1 Tax=Aerococcus tenax TaxID=3078812 RepID=A0A329N7V0_9LACT|nr:MULTISPECIES: transcriptional regulator [Aerococcus]RAV93561.1 transcriptional regulator [Aerococcus mictus]KAA9242800.1 transcriptional regulator [Aerococcus urinae]KAA9299826.1 transcriptional regulator [Aerococcus tenax]MDK7801248.1 transcriptional regulator [Aerococcus urinae]MDK8133239.1 transcriptional regulator [Aerococcus urinae]